MWPGVVTVFKAWNKVKLKNLLNKKLSEKNLNIQSRAPPPKGALMLLTNSFKWFLSFNDLWQNKSEWSQWWKCDTKRSQESHKIITASSSTQWIHAETLDVSKDIDLSQCVHLARDCGVPVWGSILMLVTQTFGYFRAGSVMSCTQSLCQNAECELLWP